MNPDLSIIMPCYNCSTTLEEAVDSCYAQNLDIPFEIVMVNDGSSDATAEVMSRLAGSRGEIRALTHDRNRGGGAARNTAARAARAEIIYCLDADNILPAGTLPKMYSFIREKGCDAVGISKSVKFKGRDTSDIAYINTMGRPGEKVKFENLLLETPDEMCPLYSTFMHTKESLEAAGGYPEYHGFDTQGFAWRYLANGLVAYTCPDASDLHRTSFQTSYYLREFEAGKVNYNWANVFSEFLYVFGDEAKRTILGFDFTDYTRNLFDDLRALPRPFAVGYEAKLQRKAKEAAFAELSGVKAAGLSCYDEYWLGVELLLKGELDQSSRLLESSIAHGADYPFVREKLEMCELRKAGSDLESARKAVEATRGYIRLGSQAPWWKRIARKIRRRLARLARGTGEPKL